MVLTLVNVELFAIWLAWFFIIWLSSGVLLVSWLMLSKWGDGAKWEWENILAISTATVLWPWFLGHVFNYERHHFDKDYRTYVERFEQEPPFELRRLLRRRVYVNFLKFIFIWRP